MDKEIILLTMRSFQKFDFKNEYFDEQLNFIVNFDYRNTFNLDLINYKKSKKTNAKVF